MLAISCNGVHRRSVDDSVGVETLRDPLELREARSGRINRQIDQEHAKLVSILARQALLQDTQEELGGGAEKEAAATQIREELATASLQKESTLRRIKQLEKEQRALSDQ